MATKLKLSIPKPCQQQWQSMDVAAGGRYCSQCSTTVVDFSTYSDEQLLAFFKQQNERVCGRLTQKQLSTTFMARHKARPHHLLLILLGLATVPAAAAPPTINPKIQTAAQTNSNYLASARPTDKYPESYIITGQVLDKDSGNVLPGVTVIVKGTEVGISTDAEGKFELKIQKQEAPVTLLFHYLGYKQMEQQVEFNGSAVTVIGKIYLSNDDVFLGEVVTHRRNPFSWLWWRMRFLLNI